MKPADIKVIIMAGGTGGHIFPALAIARQLREQGVTVSWLGTRQGMEARVVTEAGFPIRYVSVTGLRGKGMLGWVVAPFKLTLAVLQVMRVYLSLRPNVVVGFGGFVTGPGGIAGIGKQAMKADNAAYVGAYAGQIQDAQTAETETDGNDLVLVDDGLRA